jgi:hypothetical protein
MIILSDVLLWLMILAALCLLGGVGMGPKQNHNPHPMGSRPKGPFPAPPPRK